MSYKLNVSAATSVGKRDKNQDVFYVDGVLSSSDIQEFQYYEEEKKDNQHMRVFAVCDGVGMYEHSGTVAQAALSAIKDAQKDYNEQHLETNEEVIRTWIEYTLLKAHDAMEQCCEEHNIQGTTTLTLLVLVNNSYVFVNTGDSPAFLVKDNEIKELSIRHNMATLKRMLGLEPVKAEECMLLHHLGQEEIVYEFKYGQLTGSETFLLCSDGITNTFDEKELLNHLNENQDATYFVSGASEATEADNCTAITIKLNKNEAEIVES